MNILKLLTTALLSLTVLGCAWSPTIYKHHPYNDSDVLEAEEYLKGVVELSGWGLRRECGKEVIVAGCVKLDTIYISYDLTESAYREIYMHELAHIYEKHELGSVNHAHKGWHTYPSHGNFYDRASCENPLDELCMRNDL